jgi:hypothetical protein
MHELNDLNHCDRCGEVIADIDAGFSPAVQEMAHDCGGGQRGTWRRPTPQSLARYAADLPVESLVRVWYDEDDDAWVHDPWNTLRQIAATGEQATALSGSALRVASTSRRLDVIIY